MAAMPGAKLIGAAKFQKAMLTAGTTLKVGVRKGLVKIAVAVQQRAQRRVPVGTKGQGSIRPGTLKQSIRWEIVGTSATMMEARIGTNEDYGIFVEYGTARIAGGDVKALGMGDNISDADAVHSWPALLARSGSQQQMPWLRPAAYEVRPHARAIMTEAMYAARPKRG
jgi:hypothetical protein